MIRLLFHICCGPCATTVIEHLKDNYHITGYFYNPNIHPEEEYDRRLDAVRTVAGRFGIPLIEGVYEPQKFFDAVRGHEHEPENGMRCSLCCRLRLSDTARNAMKTSYDAIATTLTVGPMKKAHIINSIGKKEAEREGIEFLAGDWKKKDGFKHSCELSRTLGIYRQHYCGCLFSMRKDERL